MRVQKLNLALRKYMGLLHFSVSFMNRMNLWSGRNRHHVSSVGGNFPGSGNLEFKVALSFLELWLLLSFCLLERDCCSFSAKIQHIAYMLLFVKGH